MSNDGLGNTSEGGNGVGWKKDTLFAYVRDSGNSLLTVVNIMNTTLSFIGLKLDCAVCCLVFVPGLQHGIGLGSCMASMPRFPLDSA